MIAAVEDLYTTIDGCAQFVRSLPETVQPRAAAFFAMLEREGRMGSPEVADLLECKRSGIGGLLTRWIREAARTNDWPLPYEGGLGEEPYGGIASPRASDDRGVTYYIDRDGNAARIVEAARRIGRNP